MDTSSHAAWGYATLNTRRDLRWWGALAGAVPDLLFFVPSRIELLAGRGWAGLAVGSEPGIWRADGPPMPPELVEAYWRYYVRSHSVVLLGLAVALLWAAGKRRWIWLAVHQTQPFWPLSSWSMMGLTWADPRIVWPNVAALAVTFALMSRRRQGAPAR
jgi:hypothetical protein